MYVTSSREIKRLEGLTRSPIFASFSENLDGMTTIRANDTVQYIWDKFDMYQDTHSRCYGSFVASFYWVVFRMNFLVFVIAAFSCVLAVLVSSNGESGKNVKNTCF